MEVKVVDLLLQYADDFVPLLPLRQGTDEERMEISSENHAAAHIPSTKSKTCKYYISANQSQPLITGFIGQG